MESGTDGARQVCVAYDLAMFNPLSVCSALDRHNADATIILQFSPIARSTICTPTKPDCAACPVRDTCSSLSEASAVFRLQW